MRDSVSEQTTIEAVGRIVVENGRLSVDGAELAPTSDLYEAGMTSHASVNVMLAVEDHFDLEFPDRMLKRAVFESVASIAAAVDELRAEEAG